ncbi:hypothetical protein [Borreliella lusitaniae]|uniref:hypothetical protein n=1 Tax=Borreliella lusitaniae TaxID=100177 RepID=UPI002931D8D3|nr:hypothetical protein [Borreliella lusitaniae]WNY67330.1 hypothetical protein QIA40_04935 [Borreliella lusitaniae]
MIKKIICTSFLVFIMSCSAIGRGILIDSLVKGVQKELEQEKKDEEKKKLCSKCAEEEKYIENDSEEEESTE